MSLPAAVTSHHTAWVLIPGSTAHPVRYAVDGDRLVCFGDESLLVGARPRRCVLRGDPRDRRWTAPRRIRRIAVHAGARSGRHERRCRTPGPCRIGPDDRRGPSPPCRRTRASANRRRNPEHVIAARTSPHSNSRPGPSATPPGTGSSATSRTRNDPWTSPSSTAAFGLNHNAVRQHLAKLANVGLVVESQAAGTWASPPRVPAGSRRGQPVGDHRALRTAERSPGRGRANRRLPGRGGQAFRPVEDALASPTKTR